MCCRKRKQLGPCGRCGSGEAEGWPGCLRTCFRRVRHGNVRAWCAWLNREEGVDLLMGTGQRGRGGEAVGTCLQVCR